MGGQSLGVVEVTKLATDFTLMDSCWVPSSPRLLALGSTLGGHGQIVVYSLSGSGLTEITRGESLRALRCGTFRGTGVDRLLVTGDFTGRLDVWDPEDLSAAVDGVVAHEELINSITGSIEGGRVATGSRDGRIRVWDKRKLARSVASIEGKQNEGRKHDCWSVACSDDGEVVVGGFSNGDVRMFDLRQTKGCLWGTELPGGIASLSLDMDEGLVASTVQGGLHLWDLATKHPIHGYCRTDAKLEKSCVWRALPCPQADNVLATALQSGALQLATYQRPDTRSMESADGHVMGVPGELTLAANSQLTDKPVTSLSWSPDKAGLLAATSFDQNIRICLATNLPMEN